MFSIRKKYQRRLARLGEGNGFARLTIGVL